MNDEVFLVYVTVPSQEEGLHIARTVVDEDLAACANLLEASASVYKWEGKLQQEQEQVLLLKTTSSKSELLTARVVALHSYECPCVVSWPVVSGNNKFLNWVRTQTRS